SCTRTCPLEVTRRERCILAPDISGASGTVTGPSHSPARAFMVVKDFSASDGTGAAEDFCASDWVAAESAAKAVAATRTNRTESAMRGFISVSPFLSSHFGCGNLFWGAQPQSSQSWLSSLT